jgi:predicted aldo/keto reductase-like oxidoreductase
MPNMSILMANTAAALDKTKLSSTDLELLRLYARETQSDYCAGCTGICETAVDEKIPIGDVMRYLMYCRSYGDPHYAMEQYRNIPAKIRQRLSQVDYSRAEQQCPQKIAIGTLMRQAKEELA